MTMENLEVDRSLYDIGDSDLKELWAPESFESPMVDMSSESDWSTILDNPIILHDRMMSDAVQSPRIQSEHSYSMTSSDEGPDSPLSITPHIKIEDMESECFPAVPVSTATGQSDLAAGVVVVKQEPMSPPPPPPASPPPPPPLTPAPSRSRTTSSSSSSRLLSTALASAPLIATPLPALACVSAAPAAVSASSHHHQQQSLLKQPTIVLAAPRHERHLTYPKVNVKLEPPSGFVLPPTPPSSHSSDSDGSLSPVHSTENRSPTSFTVAAGPEAQPGHQVASPSQGSSSSSSSHHTHHASTSSSSSMSRRSQSHSRVAVTSSSSSSSSSSRGSGSGGGSGSQLISNQAKGATGVLILTDEEKRTLLAEGYPIPQRLPLTKAEERSLKKIRRKIKNKISAQESRRKKKEYMDSLEKKVETLLSENQEYKKRVDALESNNRSLLSQLQRLQVLIGDHAVRPGSHSTVSRSTAVQMDFEADDEPVDII